MELSLPHQGQHLHATVIGLAKDSNGQTQGVYNDNRILNTNVYDVLFDDDTVKQYVANTIAENMYAQCNPDGEQFILLDLIIDHKRTKDAITKHNKYIKVNIRHCYMSARV